MIGTIIVSVILAVTIILVIIKLIKDKKKGKRINSCGGTCSACPFSSDCNKKKSD